MLITWARRFGRGQRPAGAAPSRTGQVVALMRAGMDRPHTPEGDPLSQRRLCEGMAPIGTVPATTYRATFPPLGWRIDIEVDAMMLEPSTPPGRTMLILAGPA